MVSTIAYHRSAAGVPKIHKQAGILQYPIVNGRVGFSSKLYYYCVLNRQGSGEAVLQKGAINPRQVSCAIEGPSNPQFSICRLLNSPVEDKVALLKIACLGGEKGVNLIRIYFVVVLVLG